MSESAVNLPEDVDPVVTLNEYIAEQDSIQNEADNVLGAAEDDTCSFDKGYMKRQPLYSCRTCSTDGRAGVCLGCSLTCHDSHDLEEMYTKRHFRCDCGNPKFQGVVCKLTPKSVVNELNGYNQNFDGVYCVCQRPHVDEHSDLVDSELQCIICEDWYHFTHLETEGDRPELEAFDEMACHKCMSNVPFLHTYSLNTGDNPPDDPLNVDSLVREESVPDCKVTNTYDTMKCAAFFTAAWRQQLCHCPKCKESYKENNIEFLLDTEDTVDVYEAQSNTNAEKHKQKINQGVEKMANQNRTAHVEFIHGYNDLKKRLHDFIEENGKEGKVITKQDVDTFFMQLTQEKDAKRRRLHL